MASPGITANNGHSVRGMHFDANLNRVVADDPAGVAASGANNVIGENGNGDAAFEPSIANNLTRLGLTSLSTFPPLTR